MNKEYILRTPILLQTNELASYSELIQTLLSARGITTRAQADTFLNPSFERDVHDPFLMHDIERACVRIFEAVEAREKIVIFSDYDCDGIPGGVILHDFFRKINYNNFTNYIPDRHIEGYGLNLEAIRGFVDDKVGLIITVDLGTSNNVEIAQAQAAGIDVIVTDHHIPHGELPNAFALVNPKITRRDTSSPELIYPEPMLCGAGVAFKLVQGLIKKYGEYWKITPGWDKWLLDMAGIATLSDMVPLVGENRALAYYGLMVLKKSPRPGLQKLFSLMKIEQKNIVEEDITFMLSPRLNAASRMDSPRRAFVTLATTDPIIAAESATFLSKINDDRKVEVARIMKQVHLKLEARGEKPLILIGDPSWRIGVLGLVASKILEEYKKPVFVWGREGAEEGAHIKGSCRSDGSIHVVEILEKVSGSLVEFGGHELAGGFSVEEAEIHFLEDKLVSAFLEEGDRRVVLVPNMIDAVLTPDDVTDKLLRDVLAFAPFGLGNPKPLFMFQHVTLASVGTFGKENNHLKICMEKQKGAPLEAICFFKTAKDFNPEPEAGKTCTVIGTLERSFFGRGGIRVRIVDIQ